MALPILTCVILSYLLGSIPTGYLMAKAKGIDIRSVGSGNIGATNVFRALGKVPGIITLAVDCVKGLVAVLIVPNLVMRLFNLDSVGSTPIICALCVILGHNYTCWLKFKGGKGIATSAGAFLALVPIALVICFGLWLVVFGISRYVSLASIAAAVALPVFVFFTKSVPNESPPLIFYLALVLSLLAIWKHRSNIQRLLNGTEHRFTRKPKPEAHAS